jgi:hypothetical protein
MFQQLPLPFCDVESFKRSNNSKIRFGWVWFMVFNATFNNISIISWRSVLLVKETTDTRKKPTDLLQARQTLSHYVVWSIPGHEHD